MRGQCGPGSPPLVGGPRQRARTGPPAAGVPTRATGALTSPPGTAPGRARRDDQHSGRNCLPRSPSEFVNPRGPPGFDSLFCQPGKEGAHEKGRAPATRHLLVTRRTRTRSVGLVNTSRSDFRVRNRPAERWRHWPDVCDRRAIRSRRRGVTCRKVPVVDGDLGQERVGCRPAGRKVGAPRASPPPLGAPSRSTSIQTCRPRAARDAGPGAGRSDEGRWRRTAIPCRRCEIGSGLLMVGRRQRDCAEVAGAPVGYLGREYCCLCMRRDPARTQPKASCPDCGKDRALNSGHRAVPAVFPALHAAAWKEKSAGSGRGT